MYDLNFDFDMRTLDTGIFGLDVAAKVALARLQLVHEPVDLDLARPSARAPRVEVSQRISEAARAGVVC